MSLENSVFEDIFRRFEDLYKDLEDFKSTLCILSVQSVWGHGGGGGEGQLSQGAGSVHTVLLHVRCLLCFWLKLKFVGEW